MLPERQGWRVRKTYSCRFKCGRLPYANFNPALVERRNPKGVFSMSRKWVILVNHLLEPPNQISGITRYLFGFSSN